MNKAYEKIVWKDEPSIDSPINADNLNGISNGLDVVDTRVVTLDNELKDKSMHLETEKLDKAEAGMMFENLYVEPHTGNLVFTRHNGERYSVKTNLEKVVTNWSFDQSTQKMILITPNGRVEIDLSSFISEIDFQNSDTISFTVNGDGSVKAEVKKGSITEEHLRPDYLADIRVESGRALEYSTSAGTNAQKASYSAAAAAGHASAAMDAQAEAGKSAQSALESKESAAASSESARQYSEMAGNDASASEAFANVSEEKSIEAADYAMEAESFTHGGTGIASRPGEDTDNAKYYYEKTKEAAAGIPDVPGSGYALADGSNVSGIWEGLTAGKAVSDEYGHRISSWYARKDVVGAGSTEEVAYTYPGDTWGEMQSAADVSLAEALSAATEKITNAIFGITTRDIKAADTTRWMVHDFNEATKYPGLYHAAVWDDGFTMDKHAPTDSDKFALIVLEDGHQIAIPDGTNDIYVRNLNDGAWSPWEKVGGSGGSALVVKEIASSELDAATGNYVVLVRSDNASDVIIDINHKEGFQENYAVFCFVNEASIGAQVAIDLGINGDIFTRYGSFRGSNEWGAWKRVGGFSGSYNDLTDKPDIPSQPSDIGALPSGGNAVSASKWQTARNINGMSIDGSANRANYGICATSASTAAKTVSCTGFLLSTGAEIAVKFNNTNTASSPTLNVNGTGAKPIYYRGSAIAAGYIAANRTYTFRYNGTQWDFVGDINVDTNTWKANTKDSEGYVTKGSGNPNKVWKTDASGNPGWRDEAGGTGGVSGTATAVSRAADTSDAGRKLWFDSPDATDTEGRLAYDPNLTYNPYTKALEAGTFNSQYISTKQMNLADAGWKKIARVGFNKPSTGSCIMDIKREYANTNNEYHRIALLCTYGKYGLAPVMDKSNEQIITKARLVTEAGGWSFIEVYYNSAPSNPVTITIENALVGSSAWEVIGQGADTEIPSEGTVAAQFDIPANSLPVTTSSNIFLPLTGGKLSDQIIVETPAGKDAFLNSSSSSTGNKIGFGVSTSGINRGIWDYTLKKWILRVSQDISPDTELTPFKVLGSITFPNSGSVIQQQPAASNYASAIKWDDASEEAKTYKPAISRHNSGRAIIILPYTTDKAPWDGAVGLYIRNDLLLHEGKRVLKEDNFANYVTAASIGAADKSIYGDNVVSFGRKTGSEIGGGSFAFGKDVEASGEYSHAEGSGTNAVGASSHAEGNSTYARGDYSHTSGHYTEADNYASSAFGKFSKPMTTGGGYGNQIGDAFVVGNGIAHYEHTRSNAMRVTYDGNVYGMNAFNASGADFAELYEFADGNPDNEDRVGYFVTLAGDGKVRIAGDGDYILGIVSGNPCIVGNADEDYYWKYERDEFNRIVMEDVPETVKKMEEVTETVQATDEEGNPLLDGETGEPIMVEVVKEEPVYDEETGDPVMVETGRVLKNARMKVSDSYDPSLQGTYMERKYRKEWCYVGKKGQVPVRDDGTCIPGQFCRCVDGGIAAVSWERGFDTYMVAKRISPSVVLAEL